MPMQGRWSNATAPDPSELPSLQRVEIVRRLLHHAPALGEVFRVVVGGADLVAFVMGKLAFDPIGMKARKQWTVARP
jgi:hypothetical protein